MINKNFLLLTFIFLLIGVIAAGEIYFSDPTSNNNILTNLNWTIVNLTLNTTGDSYSFVDFDKSVLGWWRLENNFNDEFGRYNGTPSSPIYTQGIFGNATNFTASNSVNVGNIPFSNNEYTISSWVRTTQPAQSEVWRNWISKTTGENTPFELGIDDGRNGNGPYFEVWISGQGAPVNIGFNTDINMRDGQWHYITATYKSGDQKLYHNATLIASATFASALPVTASGVTIGGQQLGSFHTPWKGDVDDVVIFNRTLSASEIASLYNATANKYYNNFTSLNSGNHTYTGYFANSSGFKNQTETRTLTMDFQIPIISNVFFYPNDTDSVDPGINVTFNATITSTSAVQSALLELFNGTGWKNYSMTNISSAYTANLTLSPIELNYTYVIWANNTAGSIGTTSNATFSALWDCSWNATRDLGAIAGYNQNKFIGNITINNTGDIQYSNNNCSLQFRITYPSTLAEGRIIIDGNSFRPVYSSAITAKNTSIFSINATFLNQIAQEDLIITLEDLYSRSNTKYINTSATLVTNQIGPYLYNKITSAPTQIYLTPGNFSLQGYLRNLMGSTIPNDNNTAFNVSFYWSLPSGLTNISENLSTEYVNLTDNNLNNLDVNISFTDLASMTSGIKTINLYALGYNLSGARIQDASGSTLIASSTNITFQCYSTPDGVYVTACGTLDGDYSAPSASSSSGGGGGGGGGGAAGEQAEPFSKFIKQETNFESVRGEKSEFILEFTNPYAYGELNDLVLSLSGIDSQYLEIIPKTISFLNKSETTKIKINLNAPKYLEDGIYELTFEIKGDLLANGNKQSFLAKKKIKLMISEFSRNDILNKLENAKSLIEEMKSNNLSYLPMETLLNDAEIFYNESIMDKANSKYLELKQIHDDAFSSKEILSQLNAKILEAQANGINTPESGKLVSLAEAAFARGDYSLALVRLKEAQLSYALEVKGEFNTVYYVKNHPFQSLGFLIAISFIAVASTLTTRKILLNSKLKLLAEEEKLLVGLMKVVQRECFEEKRMSMEEYENTMSQYENRLNVVIQDKIEAETKIANLMKIRGGKRKVLREESIRLKELIKETQRQYFDKSQMETRVYQNMIKSYAAKLSEIEENLATIEAQDELRKKGLKL